MKTRTPTVTIVAAVALAMLACQPCAADGLQPGLWKVTTRTQMAGSPVRENSRTSCMSVDAANDAYKSFLGEEKVQPGCTQFRELKANTLTWQTECSRQNGISGKGSIVFDSPQHYSGSAMMTRSLGGMGLPEGQAVTISVTMEGRRVGECSQ